MSGSEYLANGPRESRALVLLCVVAGPLLYLSFGFTEMAGSDLWWHVAAGRAILDAGTPMLAEPWSYTAQGSDWFNPEWLSDVVFIAWAEAFGLASLAWWKWLVVVTTFTLLQLALARATGSHLAAVICSGFAAAMAAPFLDIRPHLYTLMFFALLLLWLLNGEPRRWWLAVLFVVWANLHGGFFFGLMALGILLFPWRNLKLDTLQTAVLVGLLCAAASLLTPWGIEAFMYPLKYAFDEISPFRGLAEWHPPYADGGIRSPLFFIFQWAPLAALLYALPAVRRRTGVPWEGLALTALTLAMAMTSRRFITLFAISLAVLLAPLVSLALVKLRGRALEVVLGLGLLAFAGWRMLPYPLQAAPAFHYLTAQYLYPVDMVNRMQANDVRGKVFAFYNWGGYLHLRTQGDLLVYIDGRADTIYDAETYLNYVSIMRSEPGWIENIEATGADYILWPHVRHGGRQKLAELLGTRRWSLLYRDSVSWLVAKTAVAPHRPLEEEAPSPWRDLTLATLASWESDGETILQNAGRVREAMPWHHSACTLLFREHLRRGDQDAAVEVLSDCYARFPSQHLR